MHVRFGPDQIAKYCSFNPIPEKISVCLCLYVCVFVCVYIYIYIYIRLWTKFQE